MGKPGTAVPGKRERRDESRRVGTTARKRRDYKMTDSRNGSHPTKLRIVARGSQLALRQANHISALLRAHHDSTRKAKTKMGRKFSGFERIRRICAHDRSTLALLKWGFGEYYRCGYWAALENRGSRLFAAARGSNPLLSSALRDPRDIRTCLTRKSSLTHPSPDATLKLVLKRGTAPFSGGLTSRLWFFCDILPRVSHHA